MSYVMFVVAQLIGAAILYFTYRGVFDLFTAFVDVVLMLALSYHVMVRKPDATGIRMACFTAALWMATLLSGRLFFEFRGIGTSLASLFVFLVVGGAAAVGTWSVVRYPSLEGIGDDE
ncbi:hypothetical protein [Erythrobacter aureus]|uniref:Uncharacterized protein n=1 Tax=Erythrobacter aureus TaxID=2182384 RepID=A0A345YJG9_9SPHN|nr:hypothetical protein [Erythrobacter aureus]AXK44071.1 hypothetical protein DVR09_16595 [Erythrobacter aureus]